MARRLAQLSLKEIQSKYAGDGVAVSATVLRKLQRDPRTGARQLYKALSKRYEEQKKERNRLEAMLHFERLLWKAGIQYIAGVDEVGIGPLAGPVVAAAVVFPSGIEIEGIDDSKALDEKSRVRLDAEIREKAAAFAIGVVDVEEIDRVNIYHAGIRAMQLALSGLPVAPQHILVDSRTIPGFNQPQNSFDKGDGINFSIASASIIAKVYRDRLMTELDRRYPGYGFASHKGYATPVHQRAIRDLGPCPIHRRSFDYIRELCGQYCDLYYSLKQQGYTASTRAELSSWESAVKAAAPNLSLNENKKLHLLASRLWKRMSRR
ncbi:MAG: ribonuclease HII [Acidobacteria bacterium]|nr:MAG: ribonuclease HII [Acidobacteriota bacterium]